MRGEWNAAFFSVFADWVLMNTTIRMFALGVQVHIIDTHAIWKLRLKKIAVHAFLASVFTLWLKCVNSGQVQIHFDKAFLSINVPVECWKV